MNAPLKVMPSGAAVGMMGKGQAGAVRQ